MVIIMKPNFTQVQLEAAIREMEAAGVKVMISKGSETTILGAEGNASRIDKEKMEQLPGVERVMAVTEPYKLANRKYHPDDTVISLPNGKTIGGKELLVIAGPCSVETELQMNTVAECVQRSGAGGFSSITRPYTGL